MSPFQTSTVARGTTRRTFLQESTGALMLTTVGPALPELFAAKAGAAHTQAARGLPVTLVPEALAGGLVTESGAAPLARAVWYSAAQEGASLSYRFPKGALQRARYLSADILVDSVHLTVFQLRLFEAETEGGRVFKLTFGVLPQCSARMRMLMEAVLQNRWQYPREGAWLGPHPRGDRVDLAQVDRLMFAVLRKSAPPTRFCLTPIAAWVEEPALLQELVLPKGALLDELGQSRLHVWPSRSANAAEVTARLVAQRSEAPQQRWPEGWSRWGGLARQKLDGTGWFRVTHDGKRSWFVDPDGHPFWSTGLDCVLVEETAAAVGGLEKAVIYLPDANGEFRDARRRRREMPHVNYLAANFIRAFGAKEWHAAWAEIALGQLHRLGFNTVANWSEWEIAKAAAFPYVRPLEPEFTQTPLVFRDFPDVFHPAFAAEARTLAQQLADTRGDPALIGYFLMNEPGWGFAKETPAAGMLYSSPRSAARSALVQFLSSLYENEIALAAAWGAGVTWEMVEEGEWRRPLTPRAEADLAAFSEIMVDKFFGTLSGACRAVDPNHLNLGVRYQGVPPAWAVKGMRSFDVFSLNCYEPRVRATDMEKIYAMLELPMLVGEWHFGALDVGLPASGIGHVRTQTDRGRAFRIYTEDAAVKPWCVGVHYFTMYDQSALGRFDGECYNIGFLDVCNRPYPELCAAARASHERVYAVATGELPPFDDAPEYLPLLFL